MKIAGRLREVASSFTLSLKAEADRFGKKDSEVIDLGSGGPRIETPANIREAAKRAIDENLTSSTDQYGLAELRKAVSNRYGKLYGTDHGEGDVIVTSGAKNALFALSLSLFGEGDEVILFLPSWATYAEQVRIAGAQPVFLRTSAENGFVPGVDELESALSPRTRAVILNNPGNPSGGLIPVDVLKKIVILSLQKDFYIVCDESYDHFVYDRSFDSIAQFSQKVKDRLIIVNAFSETYGMEGWRVGYALGPRFVIEAMAKINSHDCSQPSTISQRAALEAATGPQDFIAQLVDQLKGKRDVMYEALERIDGIICHRPQGTFFMFPDVRGIYGRLKLESSTEVSNYLLKNAKVITVPGEVFGYPGHIRLSFAASQEKIREGMSKMRECILNPR